jgi:Dolichyl-phosphate-mannose-protein mannosyltransferase
VSPLLRDLSARVALVLAAVIVYHNALWASFFDDDYQWLVGSWSFHPANLVAFSSMTHFYRPVIDVYFAVMAPLVRGSPVLFHEASIVLHAVNVLVVFALARRIGGSDLFGWVAALFFAVQPSDIDAIAWVGALAEAVGAFFGCVSLLWFLRWRDDGQPRWRTASVVAFTLALLTHESSVVFLPVLLLADWLLVHRREFVRPFVPYLVVTGCYLALDIWINSRNYLVSQGHYTVGFHIVTNALNYIDALYVGRRDWLNYAVIAIGVVILVVRGNSRVRFATCWMLLALAPFLSFNWGNTSRYLYQPAIGFSLLLAEAVMAFDRVLAGRMTTMRRALAVSTLVAAIAIRFAVFAAANVRDFTERSQVYSDYLGRFRALHGTVPSNTTVVADPPTTLPYQFINAAVQWDYRDPTIRIAPYDSDDVR